MPTKKRLPVDHHKPDGKTHSPAVDWEALLARIPGGKVVVQYETDSRIFRQGDPADALFYLRGGKVKLSVTSEEGKEAISWVRRNDPPLAVPFLQFEDHWR